MHNTLHYQLTQIGLTANEATVYLAGIRAQDMTTTIQNLLVVCDIKRPTLYYVLNNLRSKGAVTKIILNGKTTYQFAEPKQLQAFLRSELLGVRARIDQAQKIQPGLELLAASSSTKSTKTNQYSGVEEIQAAVEHALQTNDRSWKIIAPKDNFFQHMDASYKKYFTDTRRRKRITTKSLWEDGFTTSQSRKPDFQFLRNPKILPKTMNDTFQSTILLYDTTVLFIGSASESSAVAIHSVQLSQTMNALFDTVWDLAQPYSA